MTDELRNGLADEIGDRLHHFIGCRFDKAAHGKLPGETCTCGRDALLDRLTALEAERAKGEARVENLCALVFLAGHSEGWTGNQCRRDVQHVDAEKGWRLYVQNGALDKAIARPAAEGVREAVMREALEIVQRNAMNDGMGDVDFRYTTERRARKALANLTDNDGSLRTAARVAAQAFRTLEEVAIANDEPDKARNFVKLGDALRSALADQPTSLQKTQTSADQGDVAPERGR